MRFKKGNVVRWLTDSGKWVYGIVKNDTITADFLPIRLLHKDESVSPGNLDTIQFVRESILLSVELCIRKKCEDVYAKKHQKIVEKYLEVDFICCPLLKKRCSG